MVSVSPQINITELKFYVPVRIFQCNSLIVPLNKVIVLMFVIFTF